MGLNFVEANEFIKRTIESGNDVAAGMTELVGYCKKKKPNVVWKEIRQLDFRDDVERLGKWLVEVLSTEPPANEIKAFWFGLFNPVLDDGRVSCCLYVSGSTRFGEIDRPCWRDDSYVPDGRYADSKILNEIYSLTNEKGLGDIGEYVLCLEYACLAVKHLCETIPQELLLGLNDKRAVAVGFDAGGDGILVRPVLTRYP
jgi:hypothetical protein